MSAPPRAPTPEDANQAALNQRKALAGAKGFGSTVLTSGLGAANYNSVGPKTILGG